MTDNPYHAPEPAACSQDRNAQKRMLVMKAVSYIFTPIIILILGVICNAIYATYHPGDGWTFIVNSLCYAGALPGMLIPYYIFLTKAGRLRSLGFCSALIVGSTYPVALGGLTLLGYRVGLDMTWDKLVESFPGWLLLATIVLIPGILLPWLAVRVDRALFGEFKEPQHDDGEGRSSAAASLRPSS
jgi:hypothetical protein